MKNLKIGSHVSMSGKDMMIGSVKEALSYGSDTFMIYTGAPQNTRRKPIEELRIDEAKQIMKDNNISDIVVHAPYIINLGNTIKPETYELAVEFLTLEIKRTEKIGAKNMVLHPGAHVQAGVDKGIESIIKGLNTVIRQDMTTNISLEVMAGKGSECGKTFEEIATIIDGVVHNDKLTVTFDTCHFFEAGYDIVNDLDGVLTKFDKLIGLNRIQVLHVNDSKNFLGAHKDRHENIGYGGIGFEAINRIVHLDQFANIPKILETPWYGENKEFAPYKYEIEMLRNQKFIDFKNI
ncbi:deoxyribonuclease IV [Gemella sp. GH3]|uniref:deoxyribonuclease IV n=1 Tax=unclassified Gemella TaxID=2624949 RepID=UPI0015CFD099|nr:MULTISPECIES: deoxyribonuclease IV [unclassified Gemella]MBF0713873.1 deoxyribonuclease IV [Gemella sp. GH3.1]NYS50825.1 deoxyribonuclease IV [Gemella sp. GH3]